MTRLPPPPSSGHPDRFLQCQEAMDDAVASVASAAVDTGWTLANRDLERDLAVLKQGES
jgi:hypothetical protein